MDTEAYEDGLHGTESIILVVDFKIYSMGSLNASFAKLNKLEWEKYSMSLYRS